MRAITIGTAAYLTLITAVDAQSTYNDPQRRAYVVPFARQATDCLAAKLVGAPNLVEIVRNNRIRDALVELFRACADEIDEMIAAHDRAYYRGAGEAFFRGPYLADLPHAVQLRVQKEVDRREQEAARAASEAAQKAAAIAEQQRANEVLAAKLQAENDQRQAATRQSRADTARSTAQPQTVQQPEVNGDTEVASDPRVRIKPNVQDAAEQRISPLWYAFGAGVGWYLLKVTYREVRRRRKRSNLLAKYGDPDVVDRIMVHDIWQGMTREQLIDSQGYPADIATDINIRRVREVYKYGRTGVNRFRRRVTIDDGVVTGMADKSF